MEDCRVLDGVLFNKDVTHPTMRRRIENPRVLLLDCPLEYKKGESQMAIEVSKEGDWERVLQLEEEQIRTQCDLILALKPDLVITEKGCSDLAQHYLARAGITALRRVRKSDNIRVARACGATIVNRLEDARPTDIGTGAGLFSVEKVGDEYFSFLTACKDPKACTILLRGASKDILNELERNLQDAMAVARNLLLAPRLCPGGGATEMALAVRLEQASRSIEGVHRSAVSAVARALEVIPRTLIQNCGGDPMRLITDLRAKHAAGEGATWGVDGIAGRLVDMREHGIWEPAVVKTQSIKTAIESACMILRVDDIVSGLRQRESTPGGPMAAAAEDREAD
jgi:T-complex protein 1 subunit gamma